jgi:hypothetical protein
MNAEYLEKKEIGEDDDEGDQVSGRRVDFAFDE